MNQHLALLNHLWLTCKASRTNGLLPVLNYCRYRLRWKIDLLAHPKAHIQGLKNISTKGLLNIGCGEYFGFTTPIDESSLNVNGQLAIEGSFSVGRGSRIDIGPNGRMEVGTDSYVSPFSLFVVMNKLTIGSGVTISWHCMFLDEDFHHIDYEDRKPAGAKGITIGEHVWIGARSTIHQGTVIADGCVVAANSVVRGLFTQPNCLLGGNPAKVIRENISWHR